MKNKLKQHADRGVNSCMTGLNQKYILCVFVVFFSTAIIKSFWVLEEKAVPWFKESSQSVGLI